MNIHASTKWTWQNGKNDQLELQVEVCLHRGFVDLINAPLSFIHDTIHGVQQRHRTVHLDQGRGAQVGVLRRVKHGALFVHDVVHRDTLRKVNLGKLELLRPHCFRSGEDRALVDRRAARDILKIRQ